MWIRLSILLSDSSVNADDVECFDHYNQPLYEVLESLGTNQKVILVCHSMGGTTVARACERYPLRIHVAVYIAGAMLKSGMSQSENHDEVFRETSKDAQFHFGKGEQNPPTSCWPSLEIVTKAYYNLCSSEDIQFAAKRLGGVPIMCDDATIFTANYHSVPRVYIRTSFDKAIAPHFQDRYVLQNPPTEVLHLESDHSPFFSATRELNEHLLYVAATYAN